MLEGSFDDTCMPYGLLPKWENAVMEIMMRFLPRCKKVVAGRHRTVFVFNKYVVKVPRCADGFDDNETEGYVENDCRVSDPESNVQYARTRIAVFKGVPVIFMERVAHASTARINAYFGRPADSNDYNWTFCVDCGQVGFNRAGRLVAYDYGYN